MATVHSIKVCGILGIRSIVVHSGYASGVSKADYFKINREFFRRLLPTAENNMGDKWFFFGTAEMNEFIDFAAQTLIIKIPKNFAFSGLIRMEN